MPDADIESSAKIVGDSAFGCAGQRCLAVSVAITVGDASKGFTDSIKERAANPHVGNGLEEGVQIGPVISSASKKPIESLVARSLDQGGKAILDGRHANVKGGERGAFLRPTILTRLGEDDGLNKTEIFGPVLTLQPAQDLDDAIRILSRSAYGNAASISTFSGKNARKFRYEAPGGNVGVNIGVAAPMAYFPFSGLER